MLKKFWKKNRLEVSQEISQAGRDAEYLAENLVDTLVMLVTFAAGSVIFGLITFKIIAVGGIEAVLAELMASTCATNAAVPCDFQTLLAGIGLALVVTTSLFISVVKSLVLADNNFMADPPVKEVDNPCQFYNNDMSDLLVEIRKLGGVENLHSLAQWKGLSYSTLRRYVLRFEKDGYVKVKSNGKGKPVIVELVA